MHGLQLKRLGNNVTILEQDSASERFSQQAGIAMGESANEFLRQFDVTGLSTSLTSHFTHIAYRNRPNFLTTKSERSLSNWGLLYRILRANFDGFASPACPKHVQSRASCLSRAGAKVHQPLHRSRCRRRRCRPRRQICPTRWLRHLSPSSTPTPMLPA